MKLSRLAKLALIPTALISCSDLKSPDLIPCMCDGTEKTLGLFECMCEPGKSKPVKKIKRQAYIQNEPQIDPTQDQINAYVYLHQSRNQYAPVKLEYVDFRIPKAQQYEQYTNKLGNYRFRIFGCRRFDKEVFLNQGRAMQKDMKFFDIFYETMNDYYPVVVEKNNPYYMYSDKVQAEYVLTAEINDYFMNVCDEFDWNDVKKKDLRTGTSEMTVTWRLMDLTKSKVYCKGTTTGYGEMKDGEYKGEVLLVERAFADALSKLPQVECYNTELSKRVSPEVLQAQLTQIKEQEKSKITFKNQYAEELHGINALQSCGSKDLKPQDLLPADLAENQTFTAMNTTSQGFAVDETSGILESGKQSSGYIDENGKFVIIDERGNAQGKGQAVQGYINEDGNFIVVNTNTTENSGTSASGQTVKGYIDENGEVIITDSSVTERGDVTGIGYKLGGYVDEKGDVVAINNKIEDKGNAVATGQRIHGYINEKGDFVATSIAVTEKGGTSGKGQNINGYIDENNNFIATGFTVDEKGGAYGKGQQVSGYIDEKGNFVATGYAVSENGNTIAKGQQVSGYIDEKGNFVATGYTVSENGNTVAKGQQVTGYIDEQGNFVATGYAISENGGVLGKGHKIAGYVDEKGNVISSNFIVTEDGNVYGDGKTASGYINEDGNFIVTSTVFETDGSYMGEPIEIAGVIEMDGSYISRDMIEERSGGSSKFSDGKVSGIQELRLNDNCSEVTLGQDGCTTISVTKNNITYTDDYWIDVPVDERAGFIERQNRAAAENMYAEGKSNFCIQSVKPYQSLSPQNMYRLRASVVSVENPSGRKGAGLIISDQLILTSADLVDKSQNKFNIKTINGMDYTGSAFRVNPNKNVALILLDEKTKFNPLPLRLDLPEVGKEMFMTLGLLDFDEGENYLETEGEVIGYRYSEDKGAEIIVNTYVQNQTLGSSLIDKNGNVTGLSHSGIRTQEGGDLFIPIETALKSVGLNICGVKFTNKIPAAVSVAKPISTAIDNSKGSKAPKAMSVKERK